MIPSAQSPGPALGPGPEFDRIREIAAEHGDKDELEALFANAHISDALLRALYARKEPFDRLAEERWLHLIHFSRTNPRLTTNREDDFGPDLGHRAIHEAVFTLLEIAPQKPAFIDVLYDLIERLNPSHVPPTRRAAAKPAAPKK